jgi:hypothetical protein
MRMLVSRSAPLTRQATDRREALPQPRRPPRTACPQAREGSGGRPRSPGGTTRATGRPRTVTVNVSPASAARSTAAMLFRSSRWGMIRSAIATDCSSTWRLRPFRPTRQPGRGRRRAPPRRWSGASRRSRPATYVLSSTCLDPRAKSRPLPPAERGRPPSLRPGRRCTRAPHAQRCVPAPRRYASSASRKSRGVLTGNVADSSTRWRSPVTRIAAAASASARR